MGGDVKALIVHSSCDFHSSIKYPELIETHLRVCKLGRSSLTWQVGIFNEDRNLAAVGQMVHVFVSTKNDNRPVRVPPEMRALIKDTLLTTGPLSAL